MYLANLFVCVETCMTQNMEAAKIVGVLDTSQVSTVLYAFYKKAEKIKKACLKNKTPK